MNELRDGCVRCNKEFSYLSKAGALNLWPVGQIPPTVPHHLAHGAPPLVWKRGGGGAVLLNLQPHKEPQLCTLDQVPNPSMQGQEGAVLGPQGSILVHGSRKGWCQAPGSNATCRHSNLVYGAKTLSTTGLV